MNWINTKCGLRRGTAVIAGLVICVSGFVGVEAKPLGQATVTEINNDVRYQPTGNAERKAKRQDVVKGADVIRTGPKSQAELEFEDRTITRIGSNSIFTFDPEKRQFELKKGLLLFDMPKNAGGGRIVTPAGTAAIEGTAGIVSYRSPLKCICLAGQIRLTGPNGATLATLLPGQMFIQGITPKPVDVKLKGLNGKLFSGGLPNNQGDMDDASNQQQKQIGSGALAETPFMMVGEGVDLLLINGPAGQQQFNTSLQQLREMVGGQQEGTAPFVISTPDTVDGGNNPRIFTTGTELTRKEGTLNGDVAEFDFGSQDVLMTGDPQAAAPEGTDAKLFFKTTGDITVQNFGLGDGNDEGADVLSVRMEADDILIKDSDFGSDSNERGTGTFFMKAAKSLVVDPSWVGSSGLGFAQQYDGGLVHLESGGITAVTGGPWPYLSEVEATGVNGGTVEIISTGEAPGDMVFLREVGINATGREWDITQDPAESYGGSVILNSKLLLRIEGPVGVKADGPIAGSINVSVTGTATETGFISVDASDGPVGFTAQSGVNGLPGSPPPAGTIGIQGAGGFAYHNIEFNATGYDEDAGGEILLSGSQGIAIRHAGFYAQGDNLPGGHIWIGNYNSSLDDPLLPAGVVDIMAATMDVSSMQDDGGEIRVLGGQQVRLGPGTAFRAQGATLPGTIFVSSPGPTAGVGGRIVLETFSEASPIVLEAQTVEGGGPIIDGFAALEGPISPDIIINGEEADTPAGRTIELTSVNPGAGGLVRLSTPGNINVCGAAIKVGGEGTVTMGDWFFDGYEYNLLPARTVTVSGTVINGNSSGGSGSALDIVAKDMVDISGGTSPSTDIQMNGANGAGSIHIDAMGDGDAITPGQVNITAGGGGYVRLSAEQTAAVLAALPNGNVDIVGADLGGGQKSINIVAATPGTSGHQINITAVDAIRVQHARLIADGLSNGGIITLAANNITLNNAFLSASAIGAAGYGGTINLNGGEFGLVSLTGSTLGALGSSAGGTITIRGGNINFAGVNNLNVGGSGVINFYGSVSGTPTTSVTPNIYPYSAP